MKKRILTITMTLLMMMSFMPVLGSNVYAFEDTGNATLNAFMNDSRFTDGASWAYNKSPMIASFGSQGCCAYCADYVKYCYGLNNPRSGAAFYNTSEIRAGDVLTVGNQSDGTGHWFVCMKRNGNSLYVAEGNYNNKVRIGWNYTISGSKKFAQDSRSFTAGYHYLDPLPTNRPPEGCFRVAAGGEGTVFVRGWAYDPDDMSNQIAVDVYIGAPLGDASAEGHRIRANKQDPEGHNSGANHGFSETITTNKRGNHIPVYCYAVDTTMTSNTLLSNTCLYVDIVSDATAPKVSDLKVVSKDSTGFTLSCKVTDSGSGVNRVQFPTWTSKNGQDDLASNWQTNASVKGTKNGDIYTFKVKRSDHKNEFGDYITDVYAWDNAGNETGLAGRIGVTIHNLVKTPAKAATTTSEGNIEYWKCNECGKYFSDANGNSEITKSQTVIPKVTKSASDKTSTLAVNAKILKPKAAKKAVTVKWKKVSAKNQKKISGFQIQVSTDPKFNNIVKTATAGKQKTSKKISKLAKKTTYYVRVRTYKGDKVGNWSGSKKVKTK